MLLLEKTRNVFNHRKLCCSLRHSCFLHISLIAVQTVPCKHAGTLSVIKRTMIVLEEGRVSVRSDRNDIMTARRQNYLGTRSLLMFSFDCELL